MTRLKILASIAFMSMAISSCGGDGLSKKVNFDSLPKSPLVVNADITIGSGDNETVIKKPWFETRYKFTNNSGKTLVVVTLIYKVTSLKNGFETVQEFSIDSQKYCAEGFTRPYLAVIATGQTFTGLDVDASGDSFSRCDYALPLASTQYEKYIFGELAPADSPTYSIQVSAEGWFEDSNGEITERYVGTDFISTR